MTPPVANPKAAVQDHPAVTMALPRGTATARAAVALVCVPDLRGMTLTEAKAKIDATKGLHFASASSNNPNARVLTQYPAQLHNVAFGAGVVLTMSVPPTEPGSDLVPVPKITDKAESILPNYLKDLHLTYAGSEESETRAYPPGTVFQDPPAGTWVRRYSKVFRYVAVAPPSPPSSPPPTPGPKKKAIPTEPNYQLSVYPSATELGVNDQLTIRAELQPWLEAVSYEFRFADRFGKIVFDTEQNPAQYQYAEDGTYKIEVIAKDAGRQVASNTVEVQVHEIPWSVSLVPDKREARVSESLHFAVRLTPSGPLPRDPTYFLYLDKREKPLTSKDGNFFYRFPVEGTHWLHATVRDADSHQFTSPPVSISVVAEPLIPSLPPTWWEIWGKWVAGGLAGAAALGFVSLKIMSGIMMGHISYRLDPNLGSTRMSFRPSRPTAEDEITFRISSSQGVVRTKLDGSIVTKTMVQK